MNIKKLSQWTIILIVIILVSAGCGGRSLFQPAATRTPTPLPYSLKCNITTQDFGFDIIGETGTTVQTSNNEETSYEYNSSGQTSGIIVKVNRDMVFQNNQHTYHIEGTIRLNTITNDLTYDITATSDNFGDTPQTCKKP